MTVYKQIQVNFWQNAFVLDLTPEQRYFYIYLITNTMTTTCGIYRFNLKLAVLETGLSSEVIKNYLNTFESSGKIIISKISQEIMIFNWLKHNSKMNKKIKAQINSELKEVKDKELLKKFYEICKVRQYPVEEIFNGVVLPENIKIETDNEAKVETGNGVVLPQEAKLKTDSEDKPEPDSEAKTQPDNIVQAVQEDAKSQETYAAVAQQTPKFQESDTAASQVKTVERKETPEQLFTFLKPASAGKRRRKVVEDPHEEVEVSEVYGEDDQEQATKGTAVATWSFNDSGGALSSVG